jgi:hypothetical protein
MKKTKLLVAFLLLCTIYACSSAQVHNLADDIVVTYETGPEIQATEVLEFWIKNTSNNCIVFPYNYGLKIFVEQNTNWIEVPNPTIYSPEDDIYLREADNIFSYRPVLLRPDISKIQLQGPTNFQATITGHLCDDENVVVEKTIPFVVKP